MARSIAERNAVAAFAFMAAATWLGVGIVHGLLCLLVALLASQATRIYQRKNRARARASRRPRERRPERARPAETDAFDWQAAGDGAW